PRTSTRFHHKPDKLQQRLSSTVSTLNVHWENGFAQVHRRGMAVHKLWSYGKSVENREHCEVIGEIFCSVLNVKLFFIFPWRSLFHEIAHYLQERLGLGPQRAMARMND